MHSKRLYVGVPYSDLDTSLQAATLLDKEKAAIDRIRILRLLRKRGNVGCIDEEIGQLLDLDLNTVRPRRQELELAGYIAKSGHKRKTKHNRPANIWIALPTDDPDLKDFANRRQRVKVIDCAKGETAWIDLAAGALKIRVGLPGLRIVAHCVRSRDAFLADAFAALIAEMEARDPNVPSCGSPKDEDANVNSVRLNENSTDLLDLLASL
jgi:hypothetical protein